MFRTPRLLSTRLLLFVSLAVAGAYLVLAVLTFVSIRGIAVDSAYRQADLVIGQKEREISAYFRRGEELVTALAAADAVRDGDWRALGALFGAAAAARPVEINSVYYGSRAGVFLQRGWGSPTLRSNQGWAHRGLPFAPPAPGLVPAGFDPRDRPWYRLAAAAGALAWTEPYRFAAAEGRRPEWGVTVAVPVRDLTGALAGVVAADCSLGALLSFVAGLQLPEHGRLLLLDGAGRVFSGDPGDGTTRPADGRDARLAGLPDLAAAPSGQVATALGGTESLLAWRREARSGLTLAVAFPVADQVAHVFAIFYPISAVALLSLVVLIFILRLGTRKLVDPIRGLVAVIERFSMKDFNARVELPPALAGTEFGTLAVTFNQMAESIKQYDVAILAQHYTDTLTGLPNRSRLLLELARLARPLVVLVDIDAFKEINDFYGTAIGDDVLRQVAGRLRLAFPAMKLFKLPGDVYALVADWTGRPEPLDDVLETARHAVQALPVTTHEQELFVHVTSGAALLEDGAGDGHHEHVLLRADMALKRAKKELRPCQVFGPELQIAEEYEHNLTWVRRLKEAIREDRVLPVFQPIVDNATGRVEKYECLVRIREADGGLTGPAAFLAIAQRSRIYPELTRIMLEKSIARFAGRGDEFSVNLSMDDIRDAGTRAYLFRTMEAAGDVCRRLVLEIVETSEVENNPAMREFTRQVKALGGRIAIDDFGTGYSNFSYLLELEVDFIKIDASLIRNLDTDRNSQAVVRTISDFARTLDIRTIAEYVHSAEVHRRVVDLGIDFSQGYHFGKPEPALAGE